MKEDKQSHKRKWDCGIDFEKEYEKLRFALISEAKNNIFNNNIKKQKVAILLIALRNGSRIGEARNAYNEFIKTNKNEVEVVVEKQGYKRTKKDDGTIEKSYIPNYRKMVIPIEVKNYGKYISNDENLCAFSKRFFHYNPHSLRFAFITYLGKKNYSPAVIAKITKHRSLNMVINYTQEKEAERVLKEII